MGRPTTSRAFGPASGLLPHPIDIERATQGNLSYDVRTRAFQLEARASISVEGWVGETGDDAKPFSTKTILEIHKRLCEALPLELLVVATGKGASKVPVESGAFRTEDVGTQRSDFGVIIATFDRPTVCDVNLAMNPSRRVPRSTHRRSCSSQKRISCVLERLP